MLAARREPALRPLIAAWQAIERDQMGRDARKDGLSSIVIRDKPWEEGVVFENGVLTPP